MSKILSIRYRLLPLWSIFSSLSSPIFPPLSSHIFPSLSSPIFFAATHSPSFFAANKALILCHQVNPHVLHMRFLPSWMPRFFSVIAIILQYRLSQLLSMGFFPALLRPLKSIVAQKYHDDITILPVIAWTYYRRLVSCPIPHQTLTTPSFIKP